MKVLKSPYPQYVGKVMMCGAKQDGPNRWQGNLLSLESGKTYAGYVTLHNEKALSIKGCVFAGTICEGDELKRIK